ncbi:MAG: hypothetical protein JSS65_10450 [Armatimonadetes bacterium]|nr:hypothetical protein [Armatimonadota bacterium]
MSLIAAVAFASLTQSSDQQAIAMLGRVLLHYRNTTTASGSVALTISDGKGSKLVTTEFGYEKPSHMWLVQRQDGAGGWKYSARSDGRYLIYDPPLAVNGLFRRSDDLPILENVRTEDGTLRTVPDLFGGFRNLLLTEDNPPLDIVFSRKEHLEFLRTQWGTIATEGKGKVGAQDVTWIGGDFKPVGTYVNGHWRMAVTPSDDIVRYELQRRYSEKAGTDAGAINVAFVFDVAVKLEDKIAPETYAIDKKLVKRIVEEMKSHGKDVTPFLGG